MNKAKRYSPEVRERAVRLLFEHEKDYRSRMPSFIRTHVMEHFPDRVL